MNESIYPVIGSEQQLPFYLTGIGISDPEYDVIREQGLVSHQFLFTLDGEGVLTIDGKDYELGKNSCLYLSPKLPHRYHPRNDNWKTAWIVFRGNELSEIMHRIGFQTYMIAQTHDNTRYMQMFDRIYTVAQEGMNSSEKCSALIYEFILMAKQELCGQGYARKQTTKIVEKAVKLMDEEYATDLTLQQLAHYAGVSQQHLCRMFKAVMSMRPIEYLSRRRVAQSKRLLVQTDYSIAEIAGMVGYAGVTYYGMVFRKYEGISPSEFRKTGGVTNL